jgi:hypothetical protein
MARYRKTSGDRVGRKPTLSLNVPTPSGTQAPQATPTPAPTTLPQGSFIAQRLQQLGIPLAVSSETILAGSDLYDTFTKQQKSVLAGWMKKLGHPSQSDSELKDNLSSYFSNIFTNAKSFSDMANQLQAEYIPSLDSTGPSITQSITNYDDSVLNKLIDSIYTDTLGRKPNQFELESKRTELKKMIKAGTITKTEKIGGKTVVTTTPGYSQEKENAPEYQQQQSIDFMDWLSKNAAGA